MTVVDDGDAGFSTGGGWAYQPNPAGYPYLQSDHHYLYGNPGAAPTTWSADNLPPGLYRVSAAWVGYSNRASLARYSVRAGDGSVLASRTVNQRLAPNDVSANGAVWEDIGIVTHSSAGS